MRAGVDDRGESEGVGVRWMGLFWDLWDATMSVREVMGVMVMVLGEG